MPPIDVWPMLQPLIALAAVLVITSLLRGSARRVALAVGPGLVGCAMWWVGPVVTPDNGSWLPPLLALACYAFAWLVIVIHYGLLVFVAIRSWLCRETDVADESPAAPRRS